MLPNIPQTEYSSIVVAAWVRRRSDREEVLNTFFEAARWALSAFNSQPRRFLYALRGQTEFDAFLIPLIEFNQSWARHAAALIYLLSRKDFTPAGRPIRNFRARIPSIAAPRGLALPTRQRLEVRPRMV